MPLASLVGGAVAQEDGCGAAPEVPPEVPAGPLGHRPDTRPVPRRVLPC